MIAQRFKTFHGLPHCVGIVDGTPVILSQRPAIDGEVYWTRKSQYAMNVQLVCDDAKRIRFYMIGYPGSMFDSTIFDKSKLLKTPENYFTSDEYLIADAGYALKERVITPYKQPLASLPANRLFNELFSSARCKIEHTNGIWKNRWASLKGIRTQIREKKDFASVNEHVLVTIILHNILISFNDEWDVAEDIVVEDEEVFAGRKMTAGAQDKRIRIQNFLLNWKLTN